MKEAADSDGGVVFDNSPEFEAVFFVGGLWAGADIRFRASDSMNTPITNVLKSTLSIGQLKNKWGI
ncbi:MAG: hypothetical protein MK081_13720 [Flavobacteriales bacterium]|nr:hypothetical protein [Flavobacteriales bacterium]